MFTEIKDLFIMLGIWGRFAIYTISHYSRYKRSSSIYEIDGLKILIRPYLTDFFTIWEVFIDKTYQPSNNEFPRKLNTVIDLGAFFGDFSLWISNKKNYDVGKVYAVEFQQDNFKLLCQNIKINELTHKIIPINAAVYDTPNVKVGAKPYSIGWTNIVEIDPSSDKENISSITLADLFEKYNIEIVDYFKMDIEGSEKYVLTPENVQLFRDKVRFVCFEAHALNSVDPSIYIKYFEDIGYKVESRRARQKIEFNTHLEVEAYNLNI